MLEKGENEIDSELQIYFSSERKRDFSLDLRAIQASKFFGARSKAALREEDNT